jgi:23S rRNA maturation mini-RNase III
MRNMISKFSGCVLLVVMTLLFSAPGLASVVNSFYQAEPSKSFDLHTDNTEVDSQVSNDDESFLFTSFDRDFDLNIETEGIEPLSRITKIMTFEKDTSVKAYNEASGFELLTNEVGWANYRF